MKALRAPLDPTHTGADGASRLLLLVDRSAPPHRPVGGVLHRWYAASGTHLLFDEWADPAARDLSEAFDGESAFATVERAVVAFAQARAGADYKADEVAADLAALVRVAWPPDAGTWADAIDPIGLLARGLGAWAAEQASSASGGDCHDPVTGLVTGRYLRERVRELHDQCDALAISPPVTFGAVVVQLELGAVPATDRIGVRVAAGRILAARFRAGETVAALGSTRMAAVMPAYGVDRAIEEVTGDMAALAALDGVQVTVRRRLFGVDPPATYRSLAGTPMGS
jgi:hypothetical protein